MSLGGMECLCALKGALERGEVPRHPVRERLVAAINRMEREGGDGLTLDAALGLSRASWNQERRRRRDQILRDMRAQFLPDLSLPKAAAHIIGTVRALQCGRLRSEGDGVAKCLREEMARGVSFPTSDRAVEKILAAGK